MAAPVTAIKNRLPLKVPLGVKLLPEKKGFSTFLNLMWKKARLQSPCMQIHQNGILSLN
jgi:hypothetical protein